MSIFIYIPGVGAFGQIRIVSWFMQLILDREVDILLSNFLLASYMPVFAFAVTTLRSLREIAFRIQPYIPLGCRGPEAFRREN